jgi:site-specific DNA recombinase
MRAVIYARYSSNLQSEASVEDQAEVCRRYISRQGWTEGKVYSDRAASGGSAFRAGYQQLLADVETGQFDVVVCEALDRLGRKLADVASLYDQMQFRSIALHTVNLGPITTMHIGMLGTMAQLYLSDLKEKTKRGQLGRALEGRFPGGQAYGYALVNGETGKRSILEDQAAVVCRIFSDYASGLSPQAIAKNLNAENVFGPRGREWRDTTIRGQVDRGTGILNNAAYAGRLEWNRCSYIKDPSTGRRVARPNPREQWEIVEVPTLKIIDDDLWQKVKARQQQLSYDVKRSEPDQPLNRTHRRKFLLSGLLKCGECGGGYTIVAKDRYGCASRRSKGTCLNSTTITRQQIEARVLSGLKDQLLAPDLLNIFISEFHAEINRLQANQQRDLGARRGRLDAVGRKIAGIVSAIEAGNYNRSLTDRLSALEEEQKQLEEEIGHSPSNHTIRMHPGLASIYSDKVAKLETSLNDSEIRTEAVEILRSLIDRVELHPRQKAKGLDAHLHGDLAQILNFCENETTKKRLPSSKEQGSLLSVVAGVGFEPTTFRL